MKDIDKRLYEVVILNEKGEEYPCTFPNKGTMEWAVSAFKEQGITVLRYGLI